MTLHEYVRTIYPIKEIVKLRISDPYTRIMEEDDLPCDLIGPDESGVITKLVKVSDDRFISVADLLGYTEEDIKKVQDLELREVWYAYMENIDIQNVNVIDIMEAVKEYTGVKESRNVQLSS